MRLQEKVYNLANESGMPLSKNDLLLLVINNNKTNIEVKSLFKRYEQFGSSIVGYSILQESKSESNYGLLYNNMTIHFFNRTNNEDIYIKKVKNALIMDNDITITDEEEAKYNGILNSFVAIAKEELPIINNEETTTEVKEELPIIDNEETTTEVKEELSKDIELTELNPIREANTGEDEMNKDEDIIKLREDGYTEYTQKLDDVTFKIFSKDKEKIIIAITEDDFIHLDEDDNIVKFKDNKYKISEDIIKLNFLIEKIISEKSEKKLSTVGI